MKRLINGFLAVILFAGLAFSAESLQDVITQLRNRKDENVRRAAAEKM